MLRGECINARWSKEIMDALPDGEVVMSRGTVDYQGYCDFVARLDDGRWLHVHWEYGSCAGCDDYEDMASEVRDTAFRALADSGARIEVEAYSRRTGETLARREWDSPLERDLPRIDPHTQRQIALRMATELIQEAEAKALVEAAEIERRGGQ